MYALSHLIFVKILRVRSTKMIKQVKMEEEEKNSANRVRAVGHVEERARSLIHLMGTTWETERAGKRGQ